MTWGLQIWRMPDSIEALEIRRRQDERAGRRLMG
jgi:hypothetical protein